MRSAADCQVDCALVQVVLAGTSPGRSASLSEAPFLFLGANHTYRTGSLLEFLVPLLEGHPPFQTGVGFANRLRIQSHRPTGWSSRRGKRKCDACRNYRASKREWSLSGYWDPCSTKLSLHLICPWLPSQDSKRERREEWPILSKANAKG
jgi:hypothetical protein